MAFSNRFFDRVEKKTNVNKETILGLAKKLQETDLKNEGSLREVIQTLSQVTGRTVTKEQEDKMQDITAIYDDNAIYFLIWESATEYRVDKLDYKTLKPETIYKAGEPSPDTELTKHQIKFAACDERYIYFRDFAPMDEGNHFRIKKDGSGKEVLFNHMGEEHYSIEKYE